MSNPFDYGPPPGGGGYGAGRPPAGGPGPGSPIYGAPTTATPFPTGPAADGGIFGPSTSALPVAPPAGRTSLTWLVAGLVLGVVALVVALLLGGAIAVAVGAWLVAGLGVIGMLAMHVRADANERARPFSVLPSPWVRVLYWVVVVLAVGGVAVSAWRIAEWVGRL